MRRPGFHQTRSSVYESYDTYIYDAANILHDHGKAKSVQICNICQVRKGLSVSDSMQGADAHTSKCKTANIRNMARQKIICPQMIRCDGLYPFITLRLTQIISSSPDIILVRDSCV